MNIQTQVLQYLSFDAYLFYSSLPEKLPRFLDAKQVAVYKSGCLPYALKDGITMATKRKNQNGNKTFNQSLRWTNVPIAPEDEDQILRWQPDDATLLAALVELVERGHGVGIKPASNGDGFMAFATGNGEDCPNAGLGLSAYASIPRDAVTSLLYKHIVICDGNWPQVTENSERRFR